jgi:hypothetical protein
MIIELQHQLHVLRVIFLSSFAPFGLPRWSGCGFRSSGIHLASQSLFGNHTQLDALITDTQSVPTPGCVRRMDAISVPVPVPVPVPSCLPPGSLFSVCCPCGRPGKAGTV